MRRGRADTEGSQAQGPVTKPVTKIVDRRQHMVRIWRINAMTGLAVPSQIPTDEAVQEHGENDQRVDDIHGIALLGEGKG
jgi:hypothetical protein